ncbi:MAG: hypothetical protein ABI810_09495 [Sphingomonas bacterium]
MTTQRFRRWSFLFAVLIIIGLVVSWLHGNGASRAAMAPTAAWIARQGYAALTIDFRGHGESSPAQHSFGFGEAQDAAAAFVWLKRQQHGAPVLVIGGDRDRYTPPVETRALFNAAPGPRQLLWIAGADHSAASGMSSDACRDRLRLFLAQTIGAHRAPG